MSGSPPLPRVHPSHLRAARALGPSESPWGIPATSFSTAKPSRCRADAASALLGRSIPRLASWGLFYNVFSFLQLVNGPLLSIYRLLYLSASGLVAIMLCVPFTGPVS